LLYIRAKLFKLTVCTLTRPVPSFDKGGGRHKWSSIWTRRKSTN